MKKVTLTTLKSMGVFSLIKETRWRQSRLLILGYHGISLEDEHLWDPELYMSPKQFKSRLEILRKSRCTVLPLGEAVGRLYADDLPETCVVLTFDDGYYDFYRQARPILEEFDFPVTVYLSTFYVNYNRPVFDAVCNYLLWKGRRSTISLRELTHQDVRVDLSTEAARDEASRHIIKFSRQNLLSAEEKNSVAAKLAEQLKVDYNAILAKRILHLLTPDEVSKLAATGVDIELHMHRHHSPLERKLFYKEIEDNKSSIYSMTGLQAPHFCYPGGIFHSDFITWLGELGVKSATTCEPALASRKSHHLLLPRLVDTNLFSQVEFEGWIAGVSRFLPRRRRTYNPGVGDHSDVNPVCVHG